MLLNELGLMGCLEWIRGQHASMKEFLQSGSARLRGADVVQEAQHGLIHCSCSGMVLQLDGGKLVLLLLAIQIVPKLMRPVDWLQLLEVPDQHDEGSWMQLG